MLAVGGPPGRPTPSSAGGTNSQNEQLSMHSAQNNRPKASLSYSGQLGSVAVFRSSDLNFWAGLARQVSGVVGQAS
jgi:hypothetical protein